MAGISVTPLASACDLISKYAAVLSWSLMATISRPRSRARSMTSRGERVPSEW